MADHRIENFGAASAPWVLPEQDMKRQAVASLRGYAYQLHRSAAAWINLRESEQLYLEVAEDYATLAGSPDLRDQILHAIQVKDTRESGSVTLNAPDVLDAIAHLKALQKANPGRSVRLTFLTTSPIGKERKDPLPSGTAGLIAWQQAACSGDTTEIRTAIVSRISDPDIKEFARNAPDDVLRDRLLNALTFVCGEDDWKAIEERCRAELVAMKDTVRATSESARRAYDSILGYVLDTVLGSRDRMLDSRQFVDCFSSATRFGLPSQDVADLAKKGITAQLTDPASLVLTNAQLQQLARKFLDASVPPSVLALFPSATAQARQALESLSQQERIVVDSNDAKVTARISELSRIDVRQHLITGTPGSGKTTALWRAAQRLLDRDDLVPIYLPIGGLRTWEDVVAALSQIAGDLPAAALLQDTRTCLCLDGWSEFAPNDGELEKGKAQRALQRMHVIATARSIEAADTSFRVWRLDALPLEAVRNVLAQKTPGAPEPVPGILDLLRLPLALSIYVLLGPQGSTGQLLAQLQRRLSAKTSSAFVQALPDAAAKMALANQRSFGRLVTELHAMGIADAEHELHLLGTLTERHGNVLPIHDLYWSWLVGVGLLRSDLSGTAIYDLRLRESYALALAADIKPSPKSINELPPKDIVLAADLVNNLADVEREQIAKACEELLQAPALNMRYRATLAILCGQIGRLLPKALNVLTEVIDAKLYRSEMGKALMPAFLYAERAAVADWVGSAATGIVLLDSIAETGGPEWISWLEQVQASGKLDPLLAAATALACSSHIPRWAEPHLETLVRTIPWKLRAAANRGVNRVLAAWIADRYETLIDGLLKDKPGSGGWIELNRILVACGDDVIFEGLKSRFPAMSARAQELLSFAIVERGGSWIAAFQAVTKLEPGQRYNLKFMELPLTRVDDRTARQWIADGHVVVGWRALLHSTAMECCRR